MKSKNKKIPTRQVMVGTVAVGGNAPLSVQSMTKTNTRDVSATLDQINQLIEAGCDIVRVAVPDVSSVKAFGSIAARVSVPLVADIHFDHKLALMALEEGAAKVRVNPGNLGGRSRLEQVAARAADLNRAIRVGVNSGSIPGDILDSHGGVTPEAMVAAAVRYLAWLEEMHFKNIIVSLKSSDVFTTIAACRLFSKKFDVPQHLGITESGGLLAGTVKSSVGIGILLAEGIGDTIRVSLSAPPIEEVRVGKEIVRCLGLGAPGPIVISCPTCARVCIDVIGLYHQVESVLEKSKTPITIAIMGCAVNGPGEARGADLAVAGFNETTAGLYRNGRLLRKVKIKEVAGELLAELEQFEQSIGQS